MRPRSPFRFAHVYLSAANSLSPMSARLAEMPFRTPRLEPPGPLGHFLTHFPSPFRWLDSQVRAGRAFLRRQQHGEGLKMASVRFHRLFLSLSPLSFFPLFSPSLHLPAAVPHSASSLAWFPHRPAHHLRRQRDACPLDVRRPLL